MCFKEWIMIQSVKQTDVTSVLEHKVVIWSSVEQHVSSIVSSRGRLS